MKIVDGPDLFNELRAAIATSKVVRLAIAFWGAGAIKALGLTKDHDIQAICNLNMGGTNPDEIEILLELGATVYSHSKLHAKMGLVGHLGFVGSSNVSTNGLGLRGEELNGWEELNVIFDEQNEIAGLQDRFRDFRLGADVEPLSKKDARLDKAREQWRERQARRPENLAATGSKSLLQVVRSDKERVKRGIAYIVLHQPVEGEEAETLQSARENVKRQFTDKHDVYLSWPELPVNAHLIDFCCGKRGGIEFGGTWLREPQLDPADDQDVQVCIRAKAGPGDLVISTEEAAAWRNAVSKYWASLHEKEPHFIDLYDFATDKRGWLE